MRRHYNYSSGGCPRRIGYPGIVELVNQRGTLSPGRGVYQVFAIDSTGAALGASMVVGRPRNFAWIAPVASLEANEAEVLHLSSYCNTVEIELGDDEVIEFWVPLASMSIHYVKVADNPSEDPATEVFRRD